MAGVFEVEVDGVEHDHGMEHHDEASQVRVTVRSATPAEVKLTRRTSSGGDATKALSEPRTTTTQD